MLKAAVGKVTWVGRTAVFLVGLAVILALVFGVVSMLLATNGDGVDGISQLVGSDAGADQVLNVDPLARRRRRRAALRSYPPAMPSKYASSNAPRLSRA
jgi:hypothetical protein